MKSSTQDRTEGRLRKVNGSIRETAARVAKDRRLERNGKVERRAGNVQEKAGRVKKVLGKAGHSARQDPADAADGTRPVMRSDKDGCERRVRTDRTLQAALERTEREAVERMLARTNGSVAEAAAVLGIRRTSLYRIMKRCGIAAPSRTTD